MKKPKEIKQKPKSKDKPPTHSWKPVVVSDQDHLRLTPGVLHPSDVSALLAISKGVANKDQQKRAFNAAVYKISCVGDQSYRPDAHGGERDTLFAEGKRYVGLQMLKLVNHASLYLKD